jgi:hypothetical protein
MLQFINYEIYNKDIPERKIIDYACKGNVIRFYLGRNGTQWGDDWDDPFDSAGRVYEEYIGATVDMLVPFEYTVLDPHNVSYSYYSGYSKEKMRDRCFPCVVLLPAEAEGYFCDVTFDKCQGYADAVRYYCGDDLTLVCESGLRKIDKVQFSCYNINNAEIKKEEIIDFECKGNVIKLYLGENGKQTGDGWDSNDYSCSALRVDDQYIKATVDMYVPFDDVVLEPNDSYYSYGCPYSKNDMKARNVPCFIHVPAKAFVDEYCCTDFQRYLDDPKVKKYYLGDTITM